MDAQARRDDNAQIRNRLNTPAKSVQLFQYHHYIVYHFHHRHSGTTNDRKNLATNGYAATTRFSHLVWNVKMIFASLLNNDRNNNNTRKERYSRNSNEMFLTVITRTRAKKMSLNAVRVKNIDSPVVNSTT